MKNPVRINIWYSSEEHLLLIEDFKKDLPSTFNVITDENKSAFDGSESNLPLVIIVYDWIFSEAVNYVLFQIFEKIKKLIQGHIKIYNNKASFELAFYQDDKIVSIKASNMDEISAKILIQNFLDDANLKGDK